MSTGNAEVKFCTACINMEKDGRKTEKINVHLFLSQNPMVFGCGVFC